MKPDSGEHLFDHICAHLCVKVPFLTDISQGLCYKFHQLLLSLQSGRYIRLINVSHRSTDCPFTAVERKNNVTSGFSESRSLNRLLRGRRSYENDTQNARINQIPADKTSECQFLYSEHMLKVKSLSFQKWR